MSNSCARAKIIKKGAAMAGILNIQIKPTIGKKDVNLKKVEHFIKKNADKKLDLVVLPEFFSTGVIYEALENFAEDEFGGDTIKQVCEFAKIYKTNIVAGSVIEKSEDKLYITSFVINRDGEIVKKYRKIHLFDLMGPTESDYITAGDEVVTVDLDFAKIGLASGYDIRFPQHYKRLVKQGAEIIVLPTSWCVPSEVYNDDISLKYAQDLWIAINRTRAFDNLVYIVSCNQTKEVNDLVSCTGNSVIISPTTEVLANAKDEQTASYADIDLELVKYYKTIYPITDFD